MLKLKQGKSTQQSITINQTRCAYYMQFLYQKNASYWTARFLEHREHYNHHGRKGDISSSNKDGHQKTGSEESLTDSQRRSVDPCC
jgi:hypothetical protein